MHKVEVKVIKAGSPCGFDGRQSLSTVVNSTQLQQVLIIKTLDTNGQTIDSGAAKATEFILLCGTWIGFKSDLYVWLKANDTFGGVEYLANTCS